MEQLKAFFERIGADPELMAKIEALGEKVAQPDEIIAVAAEYGFIITANELEEFNKYEELNDEELDEIAGGQESVGPIGGIKRDNKCWFTPTGKTKPGLAECNSFCGLAIDKKCGCYGTSFCVDKWHKIEDNKYLHPTNTRNHAKKHPASYND